MNGPLVSAIVHTLFQFLWEGAGIALLLAIALRLIGRTAPLRYALACAAMLAMLAAFGLTFAVNLPHVNLATHPAAMRNPFPVPPPAFVWTGSDASNSGIDSFIAPLWMLGVVLFSLRSSIAWFAAMRLKRTGVNSAARLWQTKLAELSDRVRVSRPVALLESCLTDVPVVVGFLKPVILVPAQLFTGFPPDQLELVLIHELAHVRRHDYLVNLLQSMVEDVLFYHPAVWWVSRAIRTEREHCCDDVVVAVQGNARGLAEALMELERRRWSGYDAALAATGGHLINRVQRLLSSGEDRSRVAAAPALFASLMPVVLVIAGSVLRAQSAAPAPSVPLPSTPPLPSPKARVLLAQATPAPAAAAQSAPASQSSNNQIESPYQKWLNQEAVYIITDEERQAFRNLSTDSEREHFIEQFWQRRDPTPSTEENEYREEHYRRIAYANEKFPASNGVPGWKTDRGMIYIKYGSPDEIEEHPAGLLYEFPERGGRVSTAYAFEKWRYRFIEGMGPYVEMEFVDTTGTGDFHLAKNPSEKYVCGQNCVR